MTRVFNLFIVDTILYIIVPQMSKNALKQQADASRKAKNYKDAADLYNQLNALSEKKDKWNLWAEGFCLRHLKKYDEALPLAEKVYEIDPNFEYGSNLYAWCMYHLYIDVEKVEDEFKFMEALLTIQRVCKEEDVFSPLNMAVLKVADYFSSKTNPQWTKVLETLGLVNPESLKDDGYNLSLKTGKQVTLPSHKEKYYLLKCKALLESGQIEAVYSTIDEAFDKIPEMRNQNEVWLERIKAQAMAKEGKLQEAVYMYKSILKQKREWYLQNELSELFMKMGNEREAMRSAINAFSYKGDVEFKIPLWENLIQLFLAKKQNENAMAFIRLTAEICKQKEWAIPAKIQKYIEDLHVRIDGNQDLRYLGKKVKYILDDEKELFYPTTKGEVTRLLPNSNGPSIAGFVKDETGTSYFFAFNNAKIRPENIAPGLKVKFYLQDGFDKKKNIAVKNAVEVKTDVSSKPKTEGQ